MQTRSILRLPAKCRTPRCPTMLAPRAHNPKVAGSNPAPAIAADQGVGLARALQTGRPRPRRPSVRAAFVVGERVPISYQFLAKSFEHPRVAPARSRSRPERTRWNECSGERV